MKAVASQSVQTARRAWMPYAALLLTLLLTALGCAAAARSAAQRDRLRFENEALQARASIETRLQSYVAVLRGGAGLFAAGDRDVTRAEFHSFVEDLNLQNNYPGVQAIGYAIRFKPEERDAIIARARAEGIKNLRLYPDGERSEDTAVFYIEPLDARNVGALGYDMTSDATRRDAMYKARDTGQPAMTGRVTLVQEIYGHKQAGFLIYVPVYRSKRPPHSVEARRNSLQGYVYSAFRADDMLSGVFGDENERLPDVAFQIFDGAPTAENLLHTSPRWNESAAGAYLETVSRITAAGRDWTIVFKPTPEFERASGRAAVALLFASGVIVSVMLFALTRVQALAQQRVENSAAERALALERESRARREAEEANRLKDEFLATVSHELRTPLTAILGWTHILRTQELDARVAEQALATVERNAQSQERLVSDLLDVSRIITGKLQLEMHPLDLSSLIKAAIESIRPTAEAKGVRLSAELDETAPQIQGDAARLQQVVWNLLSNAVRFTPRGGEVAVKLARADSQIEISVADTGQGIAPDFLPFVFDRFRQAEQGTARRYGGLGLGLAIVRHLVEMHGGTVTAASEGEGKGATFTVRLPVRAEAFQSGDENLKSAAQIDEASRGENGAAASHSLEGLRVLVVDDERDAREWLKHALESLGAQVTAADSTNEAVRAFEQMQPDVLISDIGMPFEDGYELIRRVRSLPQGKGGKTPAVALTAYARPEDARRALEAGFQTHLPKPVEPAELAEAVARLAANGKEAQSEKGQTAERNTDAPAPDSKK